MVLRYYVRLTPGRHKQRLTPPRAIQPLPVYQPMMVNDEEQQGLRIEQSTSTDVQQKHDIRHLPRHDTSTDTRNSDPAKSTYNLIAIVSNFSHFQASNTNDIPGHQRPSIAFYYINKRSRPHRLHEYARRAESPRAQDRFTASR